MKATNFHKNGLPMTKYARTDSNEIALVYIFLWISSDYNEGVIFTAVTGSVDINYYARVFIIKHSMS